MSQLKLVQFGAGNIGRSFIAQLFSRSGAEVVFVDVNHELISALNREGRYQVIIKRNNEEDETIWVEGVRAVSGKDIEAVSDEIANATHISTAVGKGALPFIFPAISKGIEKKHQQSPEEVIDIIIAENVRNASELFFVKIAELLPDGFPLAKVAGFVETSIGKMVPIMKKSDLEIDPLWVFAEEYNSLILDKNAFLGPIPAVEGLAPKKNMRAWVDRKLFVHNLGHATAAYLGYQQTPNAIAIWEVLQSEAVLGKVRGTMQQSARALSAEYPDDLTPEALNEHIEDLLHRFQNRSLGDTVFRVGRDLPRKLGREDRLVGGMLLCAKHELPFDLLAGAYVAALSFEAKDESGEQDEQDKKVLALLKKEGLDAVLKKVSDLDFNLQADKIVIDQIRGLANG